MIGNYSIGNAGAANVARCGTSLLKMTTNFKDIGLP